MKILLSFFVKLLVLVTFTGTSEQFNLPKFSPTTYKLKDGTGSNKVHIMVNHLTTLKTSKENNHNVYDFFNRHIHMCKGDEGIMRAEESLGSVLLGDRIYELPFTQNNGVLFGEDVYCQKICSSKITPDDAVFIDSLIVDGYQYQWFIDALPIGKRYTIKTEGIEKNTEYYSAGFDVGYYDYSNEKSEFFNKPLLYNHFDITIDYSETAVDEYVIVGASVTPLSIQRKEYSKDKKTEENFCAFTGVPKQLSLNTDSSVDYTVSIKFNKVNNVTVSDRWDKYVALQRAIILNDWNNLLVLLAVNLVLSVAIYYVVMWNISKYQEQPNIEKTLDMEFEEEHGWQLLFGDIYRQPLKLSLLCSLVGSGIHILVTCLLVGALGAVGLLSPENRGIVATVAILVFVVLPGIASFVSMKLYLFYDGRLLKRNMILNACLVPFVVFGLLLCMNLFNIIKLPAHILSPSVIPLKTLFVFVPLWLFLYVPCSFLGSIKAKQAHKSEKSNKRVNKIQRLIPEQPFYSQLSLLCLLVSALPFSSMFLILKHTFTNAVIIDGILPKEQFILVCASLLVVAYNCFIMGVVVCYSLLILDNWKWTWKVYMSLFTGMFFYTFVYGCCVLESYHSIIKYIILGLVVGMICGSCSFLGGFVCIQRMFGTKQQNSTVSSERMA